MAALSPAETAFEQLHINETNDARTVGVVCMFILICSAVLGGRFYARRLRKATLEADDYLAAAAHVRHPCPASESPTDITTARFSFLALHYNVSAVNKRRRYRVDPLSAKACCSRTLRHRKTWSGGHARDVQGHCKGMALDRFAEVVAGGKEMAERIQLEFAVQLTYSATTTLAKASVLLLYRRVFSLRARRFRIAWWTNVGLLASYFIGINIQTFLQCAPQSISHYWNPESPCHPPGNTRAVFFGCWNPFIDLTILSLPIPMIWGLQMPRKQKVAVSGIFLLGLMYVQSRLLSQNFANLPAEAQS